MSEPPCKIPRKEQKQGQEEGLWTVRRLSEAQEERNAESSTLRTEIILEKRNTKEGKTKNVVLYSGMKAKDAHQLVVDLNPRKMLKIDLPIPEFKPKEEPEECEYEETQEVGGRINFFDQSFVSRDNSLVFAGDDLHIAKDLSSRELQDRHQARIDRN